ncbi:ATP-dependent metalloprotease [Babesia caballi]|uniref:ATP-dependent metalloprotease n=1 Tax=Babesia caballi TaxID=5871 RepID=A0AAV4LKZ3_BABCB|nr:ATP-dependent metalloprotease [Babesia caballi]
MEGVVVWSPAGRRGLRLERCEPQGKCDDHESADVVPPAARSKYTYYKWLQTSAATEDSSAPSTSSSELPTHQLGFHSPSGTNDDCEVALSPYVHVISMSLRRRVREWQKSLFPGGNSEFHDAGANIIGVIRDAIAARIVNMCSGRRHYATRCGFWLMCVDSSEVWDFCLRLCRGSFWRSGRMSASPDDRRIYTIDLSFGVMEGSHAGACYSGYGFVCCSCRTCQRVLGHLRRDDSDVDAVPPSDALYSLISKSTAELLTFLDHNKTHRNLEHQLLCASVDAFISQRRLRRVVEQSNMADQSCMGSLHNQSSDTFTRQKWNTMPNVNTNLTEEPFIDRVLTDCGCFVLLKNANALFSAPQNEDSTVNRWAMVVDLLREYTTMWDDHDMPVHAFCCYEVVEEDAPLTDELLPDADSLGSQMEGATYMLRKLGYFGYRVDLSRSTGGDDFFRERFLRKQLRVSSDDASKTLLSYLRSLTSSYGLPCLGTVARMAACEYVASLLAQGIDIHTADGELFRDVALTARCFERAVSLRPPVALSAGVPGVSVVPYNAAQGVAAHSNFPPLRVLETGEVDVRRGFESLVLRESLRQELEELVSECMNTTNGGATAAPPFVIVDGPSGSGKTQLSIALAHELRCTLVLACVLDFLRPQVGVSEKLVHQFFASLRRQFASIAAKEGTVGDRPSTPRCVVVIEGAECLTEEAAYMQSLLYALCAEMARFRELWQWQLSRSVIFVLTCHTPSCLPERLRRACGHPRRFSMHGNFTSTADAAACFELYLRGRGRLLDRFREVWPTWCQDPAVAEMRPCDIALLCRTAALWMAGGVTEAPLSTPPVFGCLAASLCTPTH